MTTTLRISIELPHSATYGTVVTEHLLDVAHLTGDIVSGTTEWNEHVWFNTATGEGTLYSVTTEAVYVEVLGTSGRPARQAREWRRATQDAPRYAEVG